MIHQGTIAGPIKKTFESGGSYIYAVYLRSHVKTLNKDNNVQACDARPTVHPGGRSAGNQSQMVIPLLVL